MKKRYCPTTVSALLGNIAFFITIFLKSQSNSGGATMITMTLKVNKKRLRSCEYKNYKSFKELFEFIIVQKGFKAEGKGIFTKEEYPTTEMFRNIIPVMMEFEQTYDDMMDDIYQWTYHDSKHESFDVLKWYNKYRRKYFEEEVMPEIRALRHVIATQAMAKRKMLMKQCQKTKPEPKEPPGVTATVSLNEFPFDEEVPF